MASSFAEVINLEAVSVTGTKSEEKVIDQPLSISTKEEKEVKIDQVVFQKDLLNSMAGVRIEQTTSVIGHKTSIRMPSTTGPYYLFMQDNIPVQSSGFFNHNGLAYTTFESAASVEVLKGAGTALYGSDAVAAVINVQSAKAPSNERESSVRLKGGSHGYISGNVESSDTLDEKNAYRASVGYSKSSGWRQETEYDRFEGNLRYDYQLDDENTFKFIFTGSKTDSEQADSFSDYENIENGNTAATDDAANKGYNIATANTDVRRQFDYARLSAEWSNYSFNDLEITATPYIRYNRNRYVATWEGNLPSSDSAQKSFGLLQKNTLEKPWGRLVFGFDTEYTQSGLEYDQDFDIAVTSYNPFKITNYFKEPLYDYDVDYLSIAPYLHTDIKLGEKVVLSAGLRYDYNHYDYDNNLADDSTDTTGVYFRPADTTDSFDHLSPKLALSYKPQEDLNLYARYANGFRVPQATTLYSRKGAASTANIDSETSNTYEIGVKKEFDKSYVEVAGYFMTIDDTITRYDNGSGSYYYENGDSSTHRGVELTGFVQMTEELGAKAAYSYSKHSFDNDATYGSNEMAEAPNTTINGRLIYTPSYIPGLTVMGEWQYVGSYWMNNENTEKYNGYSLGHVKADYRYSDNLSVFGKISNITDKRYATSATSASWGKSYTPGDPRQFFAGLEYRW